MTRQRHLKLFIFTIVLAGLFWGLPPGIQQAQAVFGVENSTPVTFTTANPTINLQVTSATLVIVHVTTEDGIAATNVSDPTNGNYTLAHAVGDTSDPPRVETWYLANPTAGSKTITVTIAASTGGRTLSRGDDLLKEIGQVAQTVQKHFIEERRIPMWATPFVMAVVLGLFSLEWYLRRRRLFPRSCQRTWSRNTVT